jgi:hypothetical protein
MNLVINKKIYKKILLLFLILFTLTQLTQSAYAWDNCPFGEVNESYPGTCWRYRDADNDNICDLSQSPPEERITTQDDSNINNTTANINKNSNSVARLNYYFLPIAIFLSIIYIITNYLAKKKIIKQKSNIKIWNFFLLITFLISGLFGIILAIIISYGIIFPFHSDLLFWHVEIGIAMSMISIFHILWHLKYFKKMFKLNK